MLTLANRVGGSGVLVLKDTFTEGSNTALASHSPDVDLVGGGWTEGSGSWTVVASTDDLQVSAGTTHSLCNLDIGSNVFRRAFARVTSPSTFATTSSNCGFVFRYADTNNFYLADLEQVSATLRLRKRVGGTYTTLNSTSFTVSASTQFDLTLSVYGDEVLFDVDGTSVSATLDAAGLNSNTDFGFRSQNNPTAKTWIMDDLEVYV